MYIVSIDKSAGKRFLKSFAIPSCNLPKSTVNTISLDKKVAETEREERKISRETRNNEAAQTVVFSEEKHLSIRLMKENLIP